MRILIVDDDTRFTSVLSAGLAAHGHECDVAPAAEALALVADRGYALAVVEYARGGREFLRSYREADPLLTAVVVTALPSQATAVEFLRGGLSAAAIDYIEKPELDLVRRIVGDIDRHFARIEVGEFTAERRLRQAFYRGEALDLTLHEFSLFLLFMSRPYEDIPYEDIAFAVYGQWQTKEDAYRALRSPISRLRAKLRAATGRKDTLRRHFRGGLRFTPEGAGPAVVESRVAQGDGAG